ncbi:MAG: aldo/keto reductase [Saccharofermentanales bacterium]|jgi:aryl-alcohol dehydrogenase-like predicted oxidoreductase|nr:aldo/keto reductase [Bacillota bacterium]
MSASPLELKYLGETGLLLSVLGMGTLTVSPAQNDLPLAAAGEILAYAVRRGINWLDTAHLYNNYAQIRAALDRLSVPPLIMTKTYAYEAAQVGRDFDYARRELGLDDLAALMLHEQESPLTLAGHVEAFEAMLRLRERGLIKAVGISTHSVSVIESLVRVRSDSSDDFSIPAIYREADFVFALLNQTGIGLLDGSWQEMEQAARAAERSGLGVLGMKLFAGGHLLSQRAQAVKAALSLDFVTSWSVGMGSQAEIDVNLDWFCGREPDQNSLELTASKPRRLVIEYWCAGCGNCVARCRSQALYLRGGRAEVDHSKCILCSYCAASCPYYAIKIW